MSTLLLVPSVDLEVDRLCANTVEPDMQCSAVPLHAVEQVHNVLVATNVLVAEKRDARVTRGVLARTLEPLNARQVVATTQILDFRLQQQTQNDVYANPPSFLLDELPILLAVFNIRDELIVSLVNHLCSFYCVALCCVLDFSCVFVC